MAGKIKAALLGFGGMGHCHASQYAKQKDVELVAVCDIDPAKFEEQDAELNFGNSGKTDTRVLRKYLSYEDLVKNEKDLGFIDICLPSYLHCEYSIRAMRDGYNVLCEKPMALNSKDADKMIRVSEKTGKFLMIAQCLRFAAEFKAVKEAYDTGKYGKLLRVITHRVAGFPGRWYSDVKLSGGALMDLHLHDIDFIQHMLGKPQALLCVGAVVKSGGIDDSLTTYWYDNGLTVSSEGSWARGVFSGKLEAVFEKGTLAIGIGKIQFYEAYKEPVDLPVPAEDNPYFNEIAYFASCVKNNVPPELAMPRSTRETIRYIELEEKSAMQGGKKIRL